MLGMTSVIRRFSFAVPIALLVAFVAAGLGPSASTPGAESAPLAVTAALAQPRAFLETFDDAPTSPRPWNPANWDVTVHSRDTGTWNRLQSMNAGHGADCSPPPEAHSVSSYEDAVFSCRNHVMTAINADGYGVIYLTPNHMVDFSAGEAVIRFDMSTQRHSDRDWVDLWITPFEDNLMAPLEDWLPDLNGEPRRAIHVRMDATNGGTMFRTRVICNFGGGCGGGSSNISYESFLTPSAARRDTFELRISRRHIRFGMPTYNTWWQDIAVPDIGWTQGIVQLGHHSYTPNKGSCLSGGCGPATWHWDDVNISPAVPFTMLRADRRFVDPSSPEAVSFGAPAPANSFLRFAGIGSDLALSFDGGASWQPAQLQNQEKKQAEHFKSYWTPIPAGVSTVQISGRNWFAGRWRARDIAIWANDGVGLQASAPAPAAASTPAPAAALPPQLGDGPATLAASPPGEPLGISDRAAEDPEIAVTDQAVAGDEMSVGEAADTPAPTSAEPADTPAPTTAELNPPQAPAAPTPVASPGFTCTLFIGYSQTDNWFAAAEGALGSDRFELLWNGGGAARRWADPGYEGWRNAIQSRCAQNGNSPDRVVMDITNDGYLTNAATNGDPVAFMERVIRNVLATIRNRYPSARQIVLQPVVGGPGHATCPRAGAQEGVVRASYNHPIIHEAIGRVVGGDVVAGPDSSARSCADYADDVGHLTSSARGPIGRSIAQYYQS